MPTQHAQRHHLRDMIGVEAIAAAVLFARCVQQFQRQLFKQRIRETKPRNHLDPRGIETERLFRHPLDHGPAQIDQLDNGRPRKFHIDDCISGTTPNSRDRNCVSATPRSAFIRRLTEALPCRQ